MSTPDSGSHHATLRGRGASFNPPGRFERLHVEPDPDAEPDERIDSRTQFFFDATESVVTENDSPDIPFRFGLNAYRGCEHGCAYCYARPYHEYLGWSGGLDFETKIMVKLRAPELLRKKLSSPSWKPEGIAMSGVTDCYQPAERYFKLTRQCLEVLAVFRNPVGLITKNHLVTRDRDLLAELAAHQCAIVNLTITTLDPALSAKLEPRAASPAHRLRAIRSLADAGVPVGVMVAPIIPGLTDHEVPAILDAAATAGARQAGYTMLRLPGSVKAVFEDWLHVHEPGKTERILSRLRDTRGGAFTSKSWAARMPGEGVFARQIKDLFEVAARRAGLRERSFEFSTNHFRRPGGTQLSLF